MIIAIVLEAVNGPCKWHEDGRFGREPNIHTEMYRVISGLVLKKWMRLIERAIFTPSAEAPAAASLGERINDILAQRLGSPHIDMRDIRIVP